MKRVMITGVIIIITAAVVLFSGCGIMVAGSGRIVDRNLYYEGFSGVEADSSCKLTVIEGDYFGVTVRIDDNLLDYVEASVSGSELYIGLRPGYMYNFVKFEVIVVMPDLKSLELSESSICSISGFESSGVFTVDISGSSYGTIDFLSAENISASVSGSSRLVVSAYSVSGNLEIDCSGASFADFRDCYAYDARVDISGASTTYIYISGWLNGSVSGASSLYYRGTPNLNSVSLSGGSSMIRF